jgi:methyltransferase (TIGR00027 family)
VRSTESSHTAARVAAHRARHQLIDAPKVFDDALALPILGPETAAELRREPRAGDDPWSRAMRAFVVARSRCSEDRLAEAVARGLRQYVVLGAGLDTFAYRNPHPGLRVVEIDHPATQAYKRRLLQDARIAVPPSVEFLAVDFERETLAEKLAHARLDPTGPTFFSWLGVTQYLEPAATFDTLRAIASCPPGSGVTFDYALPRELLDAAGQAAFDWLAARVASAGEPFRGFFRPEALAADLRDMGFERVEDLDSAALNERYFRSRSDDLRVRGAARVMTAWR